MKGTKQKYTELSPEDLLSLSHEFNFEIALAVTSGCESMGDPSYVHPGEYRKECCFTLAGTRHIISVNSRDGGYKSMWAGMKGCYALGFWLWTNRDGQPWQADMELHVSQFLEKQGAERLRWQLQMRQSPLEVVG